MRQSLDLELKGLYTSPNNLSGIPPGAFVRADNVVINSKNLVSSRNGQKQYNTPLTVGSGEVNKLYNYRTNLLLSYDNKMAYDGGAGAWVDYSGTYSPPSGATRIRSLEAANNFYFTSSEGIQKLDSLTATPMNAGAPKALGGSGALLGVTGFLVDDSAVAYRLVWGYIDANNNLILGAPSQRLVVANSSGGARDTRLTFSIPQGITTSFFYQLYRSFGTAAAADEPTDELYLVMQAQPTSAEITAKAFTVDDITPYSLMRATLYTSPSQEGIENANDQPPLCVDMDIFKNSAVYVNTRQKQRLSIALIAVDNPSLGYVTEASCDTTSGDDVLASIADTSLLRVGMRAVGTGIPTDATITEILTATTVRISQDATATATVSVEFQDRVSLAGVDYWGGSSLIVANNQFLVSIGGTPGLNVADTAESLVNVINQSASNSSIYAYYVSALNDLPGQILFESRDFGESAFIATSTSGDSFSPPLPNQTNIVSNSVANPTVITCLTAHGLTTGDSITIYSSNSTPTIDGERAVTVISPTTFSIAVNVTVGGTSGYFVETVLNIKSDDDHKQNRAYIAKANQSEAVPLYRYFDVGSQNFAIERVVALRDGIFFFKKDGIYRMSGETFESFVVALIDNTAILQVPESAVAFNNQVFCFTTQGICAVTDSGVLIKSVPIEDQLLQLASEQYTYFDTASFGVAYESARQYLFFTVTEETDEVATQAFIYNSLTDSWTRWIMNRTCGVVSTGVNKLFMAQAETGQVMIERKSYTRDDFADEEYSVTITVVTSSTEITLASASDVDAGMTLVQGSRRAYIEEVDGNVLTIAETNGLTIGAATVYTPIQNTIQWVPIDIENAGILKQFSELSLFFKNAIFSEMTVGFATNISQSFEEVPVENINQDSWGNFPWGTRPWGGFPVGATVLRTYVPLEKQRGSWLNLYVETNEAFTGFSLQGVSLMYNAMSSRLK